MGGPCNGWGRYQTWTCCAMGFQPGLCRLRVIRDRLEPAAGPAVSAMPPKAEVKSGHWRHRPGPSRVDDAVVGVIQARINPHLAAR